MTTEELEAFAATLAKVLKILQDYNVRSCKLGDMILEIGPAMPKYALPHPGDNDAERLRQRREFEELLYASA